MKEIREQLIEQRQKDDAALNYVSREAQEAILNPYLSDNIKDDILNTAVGTIKQIAERKWVYEAIPRKHTEPKQSGIVYEAK